MIVFEYYATSGIQKSSPVSSKGGREKYKRKKKRQRGRDGAPSREGSLKKRGFQTPGNTLSAESVVSLGTTEGNMTRRKNKLIIKTHRLHAQW